MDGSQEITNRLASLAKEIASCLLVVVSYEDGRLRRQEAVGFAYRMDHEVLDIGMYAKDASPPGDYDDLTKRIPLSSIRNILTLSVSL